MKIRQPFEIKSSKTITALIYGQSGMGKTTLACSAPSPVLFDFDNGVDRIRQEHVVPTVQVETWQDALDAIEEVRKDGSFKTVIIDTASKLIDCITTYVCGNRNPQIQQWGIINTTFKTYLRSIQSLGLHVVFVAQREIEKNGDINRYVPQFRASNYKDVLCDLNVCGYLEMVQLNGMDVRQITFNPSMRNEGKNTALFANAYIIPTLTAGMPNNFLTQRFEEYEKRQIEKQEARNKAMEAYQALLAEIETCTDAQSLNDLVLQIAKSKAVGDIKARTRMDITRRAQELGLTFNKEERCYE